MPTYEQNKKSAEKYLANLDRITIRVPKEAHFKETVQIAAQAKGISVNTYILAAIQKELIADGYEPLQNEE